MAPSRTMAPEWNYVPRVELWPRVVSTKTPVSREFTFLPTRAPARCHVREHVIGHVS